MLPNGSSGSDFTQHTIDAVTSIFGRVSSVRAQKRITFFIVRDSHGNTLQAVAFKQKCDDITPESVIRLKGKFVIPAVPIKSEETSIKGVEFQVEEVQRVNISEVPLPIQVSDLNHDLDAAGFANCLDHRILDLRSKRNQAIFRLKSHLTQYLSEFLWANEFVQIHTPKLTSVPSEGGAEVFKTTYFDTPAFLVQSPQLHKQMCVMGDFRRVFEIGPVFRAENSRDARHLCEFIGVDVEMALESGENGEGNAYHVVPKMLWMLLRHVLSKLYQEHRGLILTANPEFQDILIPGKPVIISYWDVIQILNANGFPELKPTDDLTNDCEIKLGEFCLANYGTDLVIVDKYPVELRPFYTMKDPEHARYTNSYDIIFRGQEVLSGAQREHRYPILMEAVRAKGLTAEYLDFYLDSFRYGSFPHAGGGFGLERLLSRFIGLANIKSASLFPRAPNRLKP